MADIRFLGRPKWFEEGVDPDYRFTLANERTFLAWIRTALVLVAGGVAAAKGIEFNHDVWCWVVAGPPLVAGAALAIKAPTRWRRYEGAMHAGAPLPVGRGVRWGGVLLGVYAVVALGAMLIDR